MEVDLYSNEKRLWNLGYENIAGCDEAGRGPLFGPVVVASVSVRCQKTSCTMLCLYLYHIFFVVSCKNLANTNTILS